MPLLSPTSRRRPVLHPLQVSAVERLTDDAVAISFAVPEHLWPDYSFEPGQHLTLRAEVGGEDVRQSYSICRSRGQWLETRELRVASARVAGGRMSNWLNDSVRVGDVIEVMTPLGGFVCPTDPGRTRHHLAIAAGSGITPVLSLVATALEEEPDSRVTLVFGNRSVASIMFLEELEDLKNRHPSRFQLVTVLSREVREVDLLSGRLDPSRIEQILHSVVGTGVDAVDEWYLCGPFGMVTGAQEMLAGHGVDPGHVHHEVFHVDDADTPAPPVRVDESAPAEAVVTVNLDGRTTVIPMPSRQETILAATLRRRPDAPYSCTGGVCGTCRARVVEGEVRMDRNYALEPEELAAGIVLACQSHPVSDEVRLDYDA